MPRFWKLYLSVLERHPWKTQATTTGVLMGVGDVMAQLAVEKRPWKDYDTARTVRFLGFGFLLAGPALRGWYLTLEKVFPSGRLVPLKKVVCDQTMFSSSFTVFFLGTMGIFRKDSLADIKVKIQRDFWPILLTNWKVWPMVQAVNFYFVPFQHRVLVVNFVALGWNTYLAWKSERQIEK